MAKDRFLLFLWAALALGLLARLGVLFAPQMPLDRFFITEDGYLMLTVARNLALGAGLSVSAGEIATNGVQPLATLLYAIPYALTGGDKLAGLWGVMALSALIAVAAAAAIHAFARRALAAIDPDPRWPLLAATLWFLGPLALRHTMNGLETGLYVLIATLTLLQFQRLAETAPYRRGPALLFGLLCGLTFLARIDGALLVAALFAVRLVQVWPRRLTLRQGVAEALPPGLISLAVAAPWLIYSQFAFGSIFPISGQAQSLTAEFGGNIGHAAVKLFETMAPMLPIPNGVETLAPLRLAVGIGAAAVLAAFLAAAARRPGGLRAMLFGYALFALAIIAYYALFFGAPHFLSRYFAPLAPLLITAAIWAAVALSHRVFGGARLAVSLGGGAGVALSLALLARMLAPGVHDQGHFQVVDWVRGNLQPETWVGAVQTGTLGYWHDRTINLDGKVNPEAMAARAEIGSVLAYVVESRIDVIADWVGVAAWADESLGGFSEAFELVIADPDQNLAVLRRK